MRPVFSTSYIRHFLLLLVVGWFDKAAISGQEPNSTSYTFTTLAGVASADSMRSLDGLGNEARFDRPSGVAADSLGNLYVVGTYDNAVRKVTPAGQVSTFAGSSSLSGWADGVGTGAFFNQPQGVAVDTADNIYIADTRNHTIRKITPQGVVTTLAGLAGNFGATDGTGSAARFALPAALAVDSTGNIYVGDSGNFTIRKITPGGVVSTIAGTAGNFGYFNGTGSDAQFPRIVGVAVDHAGNVLVLGDSDCRVRRVTPAGVVSDFAGAPGALGSADGSAENARFSVPRGVAVDADNNVYVADTGNSTVRKITPAGEVSTIAGAAELQGSSDGIGDVARFKSPRGITVTGAGEVVVADTDNGTIRCIAVDRTVITLAGLAGGQGSTDGLGRRAQFNYPYGIAVDSTDSAYVADLANNTIRKIAANGTVSTFAGIVGTLGSSDGIGTAATFNAPSDVAVDASGNVYVCDGGNHTIRKVTSAGVVTTLAGLAGAPGFADGAGSVTRLFNPHGIAADGAGNVYVADTGNHIIRKITPSGVVSTFAGSAGQFGFVNATGAAARFSSPLDVALDPDGNVVVADGNAAIRKITPSGVVSTVYEFSRRLETPWYLAVDSSGTIFFASFYPNTIGRITAGGVLTIIGGEDGVTGWNDGVALQAHFSGPAGIAVNSKGKLYIADSQNGTIRVGQRELPAPTFVLQPTNLVFAEGFPARFSASVDVQASFQWRKNSLNVPGATSSSLAFAALAYADAGVYQVIATNPKASTPSQTVTLTVVPRAAASGGAADFNGDGKADLLWSNALTGERAMWLMNGTGFLFSSTLGNFPLEWTIAATGDFNADGKTDVVWSNSITGERAIWLMNGTSLITSSTLGIFPLEWTVAATADFNADGKPDLIWSNSITGERAIWLMNGVRYQGSSTLGVFPLEWTVAATADFNADGKPDIIWSNRLTGERAIWLMNGTSFLAASTLGTFPLEWTVAGSADFNADGKPDIIWSNAITGERALWLMNGTSFLGASSLGIFPLEWTVSN